MLATEHIVQYMLSLDSNFAPFLLYGINWAKNSALFPLHDFANDGAEIQNGQKAQQKVAHLKLMFDQIANFSPLISRSAIVKNSTLLASLWQAIHMHFGFQPSGAHFLDFDSIHFWSDECSEDLFQQLTAFIDDSLLRTDVPITHRGESASIDEELSPTLENLIVLTWLSLSHPDLAQLVEQCYGTELRSRTLASIKPEISLVMYSLLAEVASTADATVTRSAVTKPSYRTLSKPQQQP